MGILACFPLLRALARQLPADEYAQAQRAPAWFIVVIGATLALLALLALHEMPPGGDQFFIAWPHGGAMLMIDAYTLWATALLGGALAVGAWVPAARRSAPEAVAPAVLVLALTWFALLMLYSANLRGTLCWWLALIAGVIGAWVMLYRPRWNWLEFEVPLVLALAGLLGAIGLGWLSAMAPQDVLTRIWSALLFTSPKSTNIAILFLVLGWLGPAVYLPWWCWMRREEQAVIWLPAALVLTLAGNLTLVHVLFLAFPAENPFFSNLAHIEHLFLIKRLLGWMLAWGLMALLVGAGWLSYTAMTKRGREPMALRPLALVAAGVMLLGVSTGLQAAQGIAGLLWLQLTWACTMVVWLSAGALLPALTLEEGGERGILLTALWLSLAAIVALPPTPGFLGCAALWAAMLQLGVPQPLVVISLIAGGLSAAVILPRWALGQRALVPRPGAGWGIIGPFTLAFALIACGFLAPRFDPLLSLIRQSLLQTIN